MNNEANSAVELFNHSNLSDSEDAIRWLLNSKGMLTVSSCYRDLTEEVNLEKPWAWKQIWNYKAPLKVTCSLEL